MKYEYKVVLVKKPKKLQATIDEYAELGWRLIVQQFWSSWANRIVCTFERPVKEYSNENMEEK